MTETVKLAEAMKVEAEWLRSQLAGAQERIATVEQQRDAALGDLRAERKRAGEELDRERQRADAAEQGRVSADTARERADQALAAERARADAVRDSRDALASELAEQRAETDRARAQANEAQDEATALRRVETARRSLGRLARLRAAWRRE
jgi:hypothetical protein